MENETSPDLREELKPKIYFCTFLHSLFPKYGVGQNFKAAQKLTHHAFAFSPLSLKFNDDGGSASGDGTGVGEDGSGFPARQDLRQIDVCFFFFFPLGKQFGAHFFTPHFAVKGQVLEDSGWKVQVSG